MTAGPEEVSAALAGVDVVSAFSWEETADKRVAVSGAERALRAERASGAPGWGYAGLCLKYDCGPFTCHV